MHGNSLERLRMGENSSPREVFARLLERIRDNYDMDGQADLYAGNGALYMPFAPPGMPSSVHGTEAIRTLLVTAGQRARQSGRRIVRYDRLVIHDTVDPEVIIAEFDLLGEVTTTGAVYRIPFIEVLRVRDGEIVSMRDYFSTEVFDVAFEASQEREE
jgi:ketosteroid isomerase-like protein